MLYNTFGITAIQNQIAFFEIHRYHTISGRKDTLREAAKRIREIIFSRAVIVGFLLLVQLGLIFLFIVRLSQYFAALYGCFLLISALVALHIINSDINPSYKMAWIIPVLTFPILGGALYVIFKNSRLSKKALKRLREEEARAAVINCQKADAEQELNSLPMSLQLQSNYIRSAGYPAFTHTKTEYLSPGEKMFERMLADLKNAERYIFMEYFIIGEGKMWSDILAVLEEKAAQGVVVKVIYDGFGCLNRLPNDYYKQLRQKGIGCIEFIPLIPLLTNLMNNRDHRKITVIDGEVGYMGGINIADEYINVTERFGHWKDCGVRLEGQAVTSLAAMFCTMYNALSAKERCELTELCSQRRPPDTDGVVQPYSDTPLDKELVGRGIYLGMISRAQHYIYICTPYFIVDNEILTALLLAAKSGVDVRIITPYKGDKWYVHMTTRSYYRQLIEGGVKVYEYTPGFIHSKLFVCDDETASVGTVNLDYRSLYLHFECGVWMTGTTAVGEIKKDFIDTMDKSEKITLESEQIKLSAMQRLFSAVIKVFEPLM